MKCTKTMDCGLGKFAVKAYAVKPSCRKAKGGILGQQLRAAIKLRNLKASLIRIGGKQKRKARAKGPSRKRVRME